jgi:hypothetical protein
VDKTSVDPLEKRCSPRGHGAAPIAIAVSPVAQSPLIGSRRLFLKATSRHFDHLTRHVRCVVVLLVALASRAALPLALLGLCNSRLRLLRSVFFCYAGSSRYAHHYRYSWTANFLRWHPTPIGVFKQGNGWGLVCASPVTEQEFTDPANKAQLQLLTARLSRIRRLLAADHVSFAGILPSYLKRVNLESSDASPTDRTGDVVAAAVRRIQQDHFNDVAHDVVLLGGYGRVGQQVLARLSQMGIATKILDPAAKSASCSVSDLSARSSLVVDVSRRGVLEACIDELPFNLVLLNEVFPEPPEATRRRLKAKGIIAYHLAGVAAQVYPSLPLGYGNAVPCCAMHSGGEVAPVLKRLT